MTISRRTFLKLLGAGAVAVAAAPLLEQAVPVFAQPSAPLFIPPQNLDMGVPRQILTATELPVSGWFEPVVQGDRAAGVDFIEAIPMLLAQDEFRPPGWQQYGQPRVPAGTTLLVDRATAERWIAYGVGTPGPKAPVDLQEAAVRRQATSAVSWGNVFIDAEEIIATAPILQADWRSVRWPDATERDRRWSAAIERASATLKRAARTPAMAWWDEG